MVIVNRSVDLVIFDLDGTLVEFRYRFKEAKISVLKILAEMGISLSDEALRKSTQDIFDEIVFQVKRLGSLDLDEVMRRVSEVIDEYEMEAALTTRLFEDTLQVLQALKKLGLKLALVTNNGRKATEFMIKKFGLEGFFDAIITRNDGLRLKPYPDGIKWVLGRFAVSESRAMFVGDSPIDVKAGRAAGVVVVALKSTFFGSKSDLDVEPDYLVDNLSDILLLVAGRK
ncbi:MAG: HAD family hydrolase [Nitrososphaerales archaeon]